jgi:hypothetical protein
MRDADTEKAKKDKRDARSGMDRRQFHYTACIPERRTGLDRRGLIERMRKRERAKSD